MAARERLLATLDALRGGASAAAEEGARPRVLLRAWFRLAPRGLASPGGMPQALRASESSFASVF